MLLRVLTLTCKTTLSVELLFQIANICFFLFFPNSLVEFTKREADVVAHTLTRVTTCMVSSDDFLDVPHLYCEFDY